MIIMPLKYTNLRNLAQICDFFLRSGKMRRSGKRLEPALSTKLHLFCVWNDASSSARIPACDS